MSLPEEDSFLYTRALVAAHDRAPFLGSSLYLQQFICHNQENGRALTAV